MQSSFKVQTLRACPHDTPLPRGVTSLTGHMAAVVAGQEHLGYLMWSSLNLHVGLVQTFGIEGEHNYQLGSRMRDPI